VRGLRCVPPMPHRLARTVICAALVSISLVSTAAADGILEDKMSLLGTHYGGTIDRHIESPGPDGGLLAFGPRIKGVWVLVQIIGRDTNTVNGGHEYNLQGIGPALRYDVPLSGRFTALVRAGVEVVELVGEVPTHLDTSRGWDVNAGAGIGWSFYRNRETEIAMTAEVLTQAMRLYPDDAKPIEGRVTSLLFGFEVRQLEWY
jgi:hypothetical protein